MITTEAPRTSALRTAFAWHRPLMALAAAMAALTLVGLVGFVVDERTITALPAWAKPTKFAISVLVYAVTWSWLADQVRARRGGRAPGVDAVGTIAAVVLAIEMVGIVGQAIRGTTSHFNRTTPFDAAVYQAMALSIVVLFLATLYLVAALFRVRDADPARTWAIRAGGVLALVGMGLGQLMTIPSRAQIAAGGSIIGAHTVGLPDGGPGLPLLGWSTVSGDLRIPHFVGMHALQAIPLVLIALELLAPRVPVLRDAAVRLRLVLVASVGYAGMIALFTWQALRGQSIVSPDPLTLVALATLVLVVAAGAGWALRYPVLRGPSRTSGARTARR